MQILVDYSNILPQDRRRGIRFVLDKVLTTLGPKHLSSLSRVSFRLYDGWYDSHRLTHRAQNVAAEVVNTYPTTWNVPCSPPTKLIVNAELAYSLHLAPSQHLWHTYRVRATFGNIKCRHPSSIGCKSPDCPLPKLYDFLTSRKCSTVGCNVCLDDVIYKAEQKLVDTMLAADLFYLAHTNHHIAVVVSSDDDFWPAIFTALQLGTKVIHVHTHPGRSTPPSYSRGIGDAYIELSF